MADYKKCAAFINRPEIEGGLSCDQRDPASKNPCPYPINGKQYHTNKGWTWLKWSSIFGTSEASAQRFFTMSDEDWATCFKKYYWDLIFGDSLTSQRIGNTLGDWAFNSGSMYPTKDVQDILDNIFKDHLQIDGVDGPATTAAINAAPEEELYNDIITRRKAFYVATVKANPSMQPDLAGWLGRIDKLVEWNKN